MPTAAKKKTTPKKRLKAADKITTLILRNKASMDITRFFFQHSAAQDVFIKQKCKKLWVDNKNKKSNVETKCMRYRWTNLTNFEKGLLCGLLMILDTNDYVYTDVSSKEQFGGLTWEQHQMK